MGRAPQKRTLETRAKLVAAAQAIVSESSYTDLRTEEVVQRAGVAKGTFFAHFKDKDALMDQLIGARINECLDGIESRPAPDDINELINALMPLLDLMRCERYVFDVILRLSGAAAIEEIGPIAQTFERQVIVIAGWLAKGPFRTDISPQLMAEGVQAFYVQAIALNFCAINQAVPVEDRLREYLQAWLMPTTA